jgi:hypothetical protein
VIGEPADMITRLKFALPSRWFADDSPNLDGLLAGLAWSWSWLYSMLAYARRQTRITTATDFWLEIIAKDFFGSRFNRGAGQPDAGFRLKVMSELIRERGTRAAIAAAITDLTGRTPNIFEPFWPRDTGGYSNRLGAGGSLAWGAAGGWGSLTLPFQCFITAYRPAGSGIASVSGWGGNASMSAIGGYGSGSIEYASLDMVRGQITDADIYKAVADVMPVASIGWTQISN